MADYLERAYDVLVKNRSSSLAKVCAGVLVHWASVYCCEQFRFTGLLQYDNKETVTPKPAFERYDEVARRYEGCEKDEQAQCVPPSATPAALR